MTDPVDPSKDPKPADPQAPPRTPPPGGEERTGFPTSEPATIDDDILRAAIGEREWPRDPNAPEPGGTHFPTSEPGEFDSDMLQAADKWARETPEAAPPPPAGPPASILDGSAPVGEPDGPPPAVHLNLGPGEAAEPDPDGVQFVLPSSPGDVTVTLPGGGEATVQIPQTVRMSVTGGGGASPEEIFRDGAAAAEERRQSSAPFGWNIMWALLALGVAVVIAVIALFGWGFLGVPAASPSAAPEATSGASGPPGTEPPTSQPIPSQAPPPPFVFIAQNQITFGQAANFDPAKLCNDGGTVTYNFKIHGIADGTPVVVQLHGPGTPPSVTFTASSDQPVAKSYAIPPGGGSWADQIVTIGGSPPPSSASSASTVVQCTT